MEGVTWKPQAAFSKMAENHLEWKAHGNASGSPPGPVQRRRVVSVMIGYVRLLSHSHTLTRTQTLSTKYEPFEEGRMAPIDMADMTALPPPVLEWSLANRAGSSWLVSPSSGRKVDTTVAVEGVTWWYFQVHI